MAFLLQSAGAGLMLLALVDVFLTVLYARSGAGLITPRLNNLIWRMMRAVAPSHEPARGKLLSFGGPLLLVLTVAVWVVLLFTGAALLAWPELGAGIEDTNGATETDFVTALYYGGYSLTTLGTGNLVPRTGALKILMVVQALVGFSFVTLTITYFMSVYAALLRRNTLAQALHHLSAGSGDAAEILTRLGPDGDFRPGSGHLADTALNVIDLLESHHLYPVLHYFRMSDARYAMSRICLLALDTACLAQTVLGPKHRNFAHSAAVQMLWGARSTCWTTPPGHSCPKMRANARRSRRMWTRRGSASEALSARWPSAVSRPAKRERGRRNGILSSGGSGSPPFAPSPKLAATRGPRSRAGFRKARSKKTIRHAAETNENANDGGGFARNLQLTAQLPDHVVEISSSRPRFTSCSVRPRGTRGTDEWRADGDRYARRWLRSRCPAVRRHRHRLWR